MDRDTLPVRWLVAVILGMVIIGVGVYAALGRDTAYVYSGPQARQLKTPLKFSERGSFKIMQLTDMHLGEAQDTEWGPLQDVRTYLLLKRLIPYENPDLIILSGDVLTGNDCDANATAYYKQMGEFLMSFGIPWALVFGNHDDMDFSRNVPEPIEAKTKRPKLALVDQEFSLSLTQMGPSYVTGTSNYILPIYSPIDDSILAQVVLLDSGGGSIPKQFDVSQVKWLRQQLKALPIPAVAFQHISSPKFSFDQARCVGTNGDGGFAPMQTDSGMLDLMESDGNVMFVAVGHNHGNDYCCPVGESSLHFCFGKHSGYGGYTGVPTRGARVYELTLLEKNKIRRRLVEDDQNQVQWKTWVRLEDGDKVDKYSPF
jgi:predicted phosphodiesterase